MNIKTMAKQIDLNYHFTFVFGYCLNPFLDTVYNVQTANK